MKQDMFRMTVITWGGLVLLNACVFPFFGHGTPQEYLNTCIDTTVACWIMYINLSMCVK